MSNTINIRFHRKRLKYLTTIKKWNRDQRAHINDCWKPSLGASKPDLIEFHREELKLRRRRQFDRTANSAVLRPSKNADPSYRKSIWPAEKITRRAA